MGGLFGRGGLRRGGLPGAKAMRALLALGLLVGLSIILCASANAATAHRAKPRHVIVDPAKV
jgi:hypothetical protein